MKSFNVKATKNTPEIYLNSSGSFSIRGRSLPENVVSFYTPVLEWIKLNMPENVSVEVDLDYINSSSTKKLMEMLKIIDQSNQVTSFHVNWIYEEDDEDAMEKGKIMEELLAKAVFSYQISQYASC